MPFYTSRVLGWFHLNLCDNSAMKAVSVFMDVEDPINPLADDAALDFPRLFDQAGVRGSFCLTGEKCRTLLARGRIDVANAYRPHSLGLHTNTHSFHPSTMELLANLNWAEGCVAAFESEVKGFDAFRHLVGRDPEFWGGGGNTWSPEITDAMKRLGIPAYVYALTEFPDHAVHRFNGVVALPQALSISEVEWADDEESAYSSRRVLSALDSINHPWVGIFVGHPTKFRYTDWWDAPYYGGRTPNSPQYGIPVSQATYERSKANLYRFLMQLKERANVLGVDETLKLPWNFRPPSEIEWNYYRERTPARLRGAKNWPIHYPGLDPEMIVAKTLALSDTLGVGVFQSANDLQS